MANETVSSGLTVMQATMIQEARFLVDNLASLVPTVDRTDLALGQTSVIIPTFASAVATELVEGQEVSATQGTASGVTLTPTTKAAYRETVTDIVNMQNGAQYGAKYGRKAASAILKKINTDLFRLGAGFSTTAGTAGTAISLAVLQNAVFKARQNGTVGDLFCVMTYSVFDELVTDIRGSASTHNYAISDSVINAVYAGEMPPLFGARIFAIQDAGNTLEDSSGNIILPLYSRDAISIAFGADPLNGGVAWTSRIEFQRIAAKAGFDAVATAAYDVKEVNDLCGVGILCRNGAAASA